MDYWHTFTLVVSWSTVHLILSLSSTKGYASHQVDFAQVFTHAPLDEDINLKIPQGWYVQVGKLVQHTDPTHRDTAHYIKLLKTLYDVKQAARQWHKHISTGLTKLGFTVSRIDPCLYIHHDCIILLYVDDCLLFSPDNPTIDDIIKQLSESFKIGDQGNIQDFLGIRISTDKHGNTHLQQTGLINKILHDLGLQEAHPKPTPAIHVLHLYTNGHPREDIWSYHSIIGKLNFLAQMTRPDISMAVHNCARFTNSPTSLHEQALKHIGRYFAHTRDIGLIYTSTNSGTLEICTWMQTSQGHGIRSSPISGTLFSPSPATLSSTMASQFNGAANYNQKSP